MVVPADPDELALTLGLAYGGWWKVLTTISNLK
jgi:hypothetical protein